MPKFLIMSILMMLATMATVTYAQPACVQQLIPCSPFLNNATAKPTNDCCTPVKDAVSNQLPCLCSLYNNPILLSSFNISVDSVLRISQECGVTVDPNNCTASTPTSAPSPPGESGDADRIAMTGMATLFLFLFSIALY